MPSPLLVAHTHLLLLHMIRKRHFIRIVCLPNEKRINAFASYLRKVVGDDEYGKGMLRIQHLAMAGSLHWTSYHDPSGEETEACRFASLIIAIAAPTLITLTIFGIRGDHGDTYAGREFYPILPCWYSVISESIFPKLRDLIAIEQARILLVVWDEDETPDNRAYHESPDKRAYQLRYPSLRRAFIPGCDGTLPSALPYLADLRLDMLYGEPWISPPPREELDHVRSLIIDAPAPSFFNDTRGRLSREQDEYNSEYQTLVEEVGNPERSGVVVSAYGFNPYRHRNLDCLLSAWADAVGGGEGCWTTAWVSE